MLQDIVKQPANNNKTKRVIKKNFNDLEKEHPAFSEFHLEKPYRLAGDYCQKLDIAKDVLVYFEKYVNAFVLNNGSLLDKKTGGTDFYRVKHNLGYHQFADIIKKLSFDNLNFNKNYVKYGCEKLRKIMLVF